MEQQTVLIVGGTDGIGRAVAEALARNYAVWIVGRDRGKGDSFTKQFGPHAHFVQTDVSLMQNVVLLGEQLKASLTRLDYVIHTADVLRTDREDTAEGLEMAIAINYYSRVLLNELLLQQYRPERIVHVAAAGFPMNSKFEKKFPVSASAGGFSAHGYGQLANDFYGLWMNKRQGVPRFNILNPGIVDTDIRRNAKIGGWLRVLMPVMGFFMTLNQVSPAAYAKVVIAIIENENEAADRFTLIDKRGRGIRGNANINDENTQRYVYEKTIEGLTAIVGPLESITAKP